MTTRRTKCPYCDTIYPGWRRFDFGPFDLEPCGCDEVPEPEAVDADGEKEPSR